ncbi:MAG: DJ-1/PfpI family protein [Dethiosulfatibacter sp.]|nr:DJ-1/PfpI family protein [Dethiosulfatibacter sp.]
MEKKNVGILLFNDVETLDFAGPFEVFSVTGQREGEGNFNVFTIAKEKIPVLAINGLSINPHYAMNDCPQIDILIIPGGFGTRALLNEKYYIDWVLGKSKEASLVLSVCTGSLLLAKAGLLSGLKATTHHECLDLLASLDPSIRIKRERFTDNGNIITAAGIAAGIDMSLYVVGKLVGQAAAEETAKHMEYPYWDIEIYE